VTSKLESWLTAMLGYTFNDARLLQQALTHRSFAGENNERLEFLGDAVLDLVIADIVFAAHGSGTEGELSRQRAALVNKASLAEIASQLGIGEFLRLGSGERKTGGHRRESILADALEALFGAVYVDAGFETAARIVRQVFAERLQKLPADADLRDPKTRLQELLQAEGSELPEYELIRTSGKAHRQIFEVHCSIRQASLESRGSGTTRRNAEQDAAQEMLRMLTADGDYSV